MIWIIGGVVIATVTITISVIVIVLWERKQQLLLRTKIQDQLKLQEAASIEAAHLAETELKVSTAKWSKRVWGLFLLGSISKRG